MVDVANGWSLSIAEQNHHFNKYAPLMGENLTYAKDRYTHETARMYRVLNTQPEQSKYVAGGFFLNRRYGDWALGFPMGGPETDTRG